MVVHRSTAAVASSLRVPTQSPVNPLAGQWHHHISCGPKAVAQVQGSLWAPHAKVQKPPEKMLCRCEHSYLCSAFIFLAGNDHGSVKCLLHLLSGVSQITLLHARSFSYLTSLMSVLKPSSMCKIGSKHVVLLSTSGLNF